MNKILAIDERLGKKIAAKHFNIFMWGLIIVLISMGAMFAVTLARFTYYALLIISFIFFNYTITLVANYFQKKKTKYSTHFFGGIGVMILALLFGVQSPQIPFKLVILILGVVLMLPGLKDLLKN